MRCMFHSTHPVRRSRFQRFTTDSPPLGKICATLDGVRRLQRLGYRVEFFPCAPLLSLRTRKGGALRLHAMFSLRTAFILAHAQGRCASVRRKPFPCAPLLSLRTRKGGALRSDAISDIFSAIRHISEPPWGHPMAAANASLASENVPSHPKICRHCCEFWRTAL